MIMQNLKRYIYEALIKTHMLKKMVLAELVQKEPDVQAFVAVVMKDNSNEECMNLIISTGSSGTNALNKLPDIRKYMPKEYNCDCEGLEQVYFRSQRRNADIDGPIRNKPLFDYIKKLLYTKIDKNIVDNSSINSLDIVELEDYDESTYDTWKIIDIR